MLLLITCYLLIFVWKGKPLDGCLNGTSADTPQSILQLQQLLIERRKTKQEFNKSLRLMSLMEQDFKFLCDEKASALVKTV